MLGKRSIEQDLLYNHEEKEVKDLNLNFVVTGVRKWGVSGGVPTRAGRVFGARKCKG